MRSIWSFLTTQFGGGQAARPDNPMFPERIDELELELHELRERVIHLELHCGGREVMAQRREWIAKAGVPIERD